ncbi:MAG: histidine phosphatase family protein, partial [Actinomycetota bacterium]|nr:histidine phosphatase family protein [Actinomycetota bacterium]
MTRLYLVRHGRAAAGWNTDPDPRLDALGLDQATSVARRLAPLGPLPILSSPLLRCRQTAAPLAEIWQV